MAVAILHECRDCSVNISLLDSVGSEGIVGGVVNLVESPDLYWRGLLPCGWEVGLSDLDGVPAGERVLVLSTCTVRILGGGHSLFRVIEGWVLVLIFVESITRSGLFTPSPVVVVSLSQPLVVEAHVAADLLVMEWGAHGEGVSSEVDVVEGLDGAATLDVGGLGGAGSEHWHVVSLSSLLFVVLFGVWSGGDSMMSMSTRITVVLHPGALENLHLGGLVGSSVHVRSVVDI